MPAQAVTTAAKVKKVRKAGFEVRKAGFTVGLSATAGTERTKTLTALTLSHGARVLVFLRFQLGEGASQTFRIRRSNISTGWRLPETSSFSMHWGRMPEAKKYP